MPSSPLVMQKNLNLCHWRNTWINSQNICCQIFIIYRRADSLQLPLNSVPPGPMNSWGNICHSLHRDLREGTRSYTTNISALYYIIPEWIVIACPFLTSPQTRWPGNINSEPGLNKSMMQALMVKGNQEPEKYTQSVCNISIILERVCL